eukprot:5905468-Pyramimonas_sp.AAC.1
MASERSGFFRSGMTRGRGRSQLRASASRAIAEGGRRLAWQGFMASSYLLRWVGRNPQYASTTV